MPMKNSNDTIGNRTRDLPACSAVQLTAPPRTPNKRGVKLDIWRNLCRIGTNEGLIWKKKKKTAASHASLHAGNFLIGWREKTSFSTIQLRMARSYAFYCPCTASFDGLLFTYNSLTKIKMVHPFQTVYNVSNRLYDSSWFTSELAIINAAVSAVITK